MQSKSKCFRLTLVAAGLAIAASAAFAAESNSGQLSKQEHQVSQSNHLDAKVISFVYHPKRIYEIKTRVGMFTVIQFPKGERIKGVAISDTTFWGYHVTGDKQRLLIRPMEEGRYNSATVITDKSTYLFSLRSYGDHHPWYQYVDWKVSEDAAPATGVLGGDVPGLIELSSKSSPAAVTGLEDQSDSEKQKKDPSSWVVDIAKAHFDYRIENETNAPFAPLRVFDDGTFTYIQMPKVQDMPALFAMNKDGSIRLVDYVVKGNYILVQRVLPGILLKLDDQEVRVIRYE